MIYSLKPLLQYQEGSIIKERYIPGITELDGVNDVIEGTLCVSVNLITKTVRLDVNMNSGITFFASQEFYNDSIKQISSGLKNIFLKPATAITTTLSSRLWRTLS